MMKFLLAGAGLAVVAGSAALAQPAPYAQPNQRPAYAPRDGVQDRAEVVQRVRNLFGRMDRNRDGFLTREEAQSLGQRDGQRADRRAQRRADPARQQARAAQAFDRMDINRNGVITRDEFAQVRAQRGERRAQRADNRGMRMGGRMGLRGQMFAMADFNRDNRVSLQEATDAAVRHFDAIDVNRDGRVTREERQQVRQRMLGNRGVRG